LIVARHILPQPVQRLIDEFARLPGIGPKSASRLTFYLLRAANDQALDLAEALQDLKQRTQFCSVCFNITEDDPCLICQDETRDEELLCVVEEPLDVLALERTRAFKGRYHVLHGAISPVDGIGPERLHIRELIDRVSARRGAGEPYEEIVIATNPTLEGEATAMYIAERIGSQVGTVSRIARGIPVGGDLEYADEVTLVRALQGRHQLEGAPDR